MYIYIFFKIFIYFTERGKEEERTGEKHGYVRDRVASHMPPSGGLAPNPGVCPDWDLNLGPFASQAGAQSM